MIKKLLFFSFILFISFKINSQNSSKDESLLKKIKFHKGVNNDSLYYFSKELQKSSNLCMKYKGKISEALFLYVENNYTESEKIANNIVNDLSKKEDYCFKKLRIESYNRLFWIKKNQNKFNEAFAYIIKIKEILKTIPEDSDYFYTLKYGSQINMACVKSLLGYQNEAIQILKETLKDYAKIKTDNEHSNYSKIQNHASIYNIIAEAYLNSSQSYNSDNLDSASVYLKKAFSMAKKFNPPHKDSETIYNLREAEVLIAKKEFNKAISLVQKYSKNSIEFNTTQHLNSLKAICFYNLNNKDSALYYSNKYLIKYNKKKNHKKRLIAIYDILSNEYYKSKQLDSAFKYSELTINELNLYNKSKSEINKAHYLYNYNNIQKLNNDIIKKEQNDKNIFLVILFSIIILGVIITFLFFKRNRKISNDLSDLKSGTFLKDLSQKTEYNIDEQLEEKLLKGLNELENSTDFLDINFNINTLAKRLETNTSYLSYTINKEKNKSFKQYITELRIEHLIKKLKEDPKFRNYTIKFIAEEIGYTNASAFTRAFKKYKGITPSDFIKSLD